MQIIKLVTIIIFLIGFACMLYAEKPSKKTKTSQIVLQQKQNGSKEQTKFKNSITFTFVDENNKPIKGIFTLHAYENGKYKKNWHRYIPLDEKGSITINKFPKEFQFGASSNDEFYFHWVLSSDLEPNIKEIVYHCKPSGAMKFEITSFPKKYFNSLVVEYHKKIKNGKYKRVRGIGIFPNDQEHVIGDLKPGEYFIAIKFHYEDKKPFYKSANFKIKLKEYTELPKIVISAEDIKKSKR